MTNFKNVRGSLVTIVYLVVSAWSVFAQDQVGHAKYELIRETINFLATDKAVSQDTSFDISCETLDYDCFTDQLASKPIAGIERWYASWRAMRVTDEAGLVALRDQVFADIFERPGKSYRKQLPGYEAYVARVERLMHPAVEETPMEQIAVDTSQESLPGTDELLQTNPEQFASRNDNTKTDNNMIAYLALAIGIIALVIAALSVFKKKDQQSTADFRALHERLDALTTEMKHLEQKVTDAQIKEAVSSLTEIMEAIEKRVVDLENRHNPKP
ncbi:hypothetical protein JHJ32_10510 [Parapedobacter sp. ISTM3]|uniref:hypothetical protein n=1 Tax=Parapedobacter sp. ISTM3 TaxID=2800130 RepID=UPI00190891AE|nr:hypothetical protein [Parapedobacter sp. ISTM3]MBK1440418.1 hypothetical protein [Parapedobacter sp. ISTM3]